MDVVLTAAAELAEPYRLLMLVAGVFAGLIIGVVPGIDKFAAEYVSDKAVGEDGYLGKRGLVSLPKARLDEVRKSVLGLVPMKGDALTN